jgi:hypothetical protein
MGLEIKESDWKLLRRLRKVALERFCERALADVQSTMADSGAGYHDCYLKVFDLIRAHDKTISRIFDDPRRSTALISLADMKHEGLLNADELAQFSAEAREAIDHIEELRRA